MNAHLSVAYLMRVDASDKPGGDVEHIRNFIRCCSAAAERRGMVFHGEICTNLNPLLSAVDVVHLTNLDRPVDLYAQYLAAKQAHKPLVITTIHHSYREIERYERHGRGGWIGTLSGLLGFYKLEAARIAIKSRRYPQLRHALLRTLRVGMRSAQARVLQDCAFVLATTEKEAKDIAEEIATIPEGRLIILRHGVDHEKLTTAGHESPRPIELSVVARVESRKNQIAVLDAVNVLDKAALFVGPVNPNHKAYGAKLRQRIAASKSTYVPGVPPREVPGILARSAIHVSASWFEVSSLVDLDAYLQGCRVVASRCGGTQELLGDDAHYVDPSSPQDIRTGIEKALADVQAGRRNDIHALQRRMETWDQVGDRLLDTYLKACSTAGK